MEEHRSRLHLAEVFGCRNVPAPHVPMTFSGLCCVNAEPS